MDILRRSFLQAVGSAVSLFGLKWLFPKPQPLNPELVTNEDGSRPGGRVDTSNCRLYLDDPNIGLLGQGFHLEYSQPVWRYDPKKETLTPDTWIAEFGDKTLQEMIEECRKTSGYYRDGDEISYIGGRPVARVYFDRLIAPSSLMREFRKRFDDVTKVRGNSLRGEAYEKIVDRVGQEFELTYKSQPFVLKDVVITGVATVVHAQGMTILEGVQLIGNAVELS